MRFLTPLAAALAWYDLEQFGVGIYSLTLTFEAYPPVGVICSGIGVLLSVSIPTDTLFRAADTSQPSGRRDC